MTRSPHSRSSLAPEAGGLPLRPTRHLVIEDRPTKGEWWLLAAGASVAMWLVTFKFIGWL